MTDQLLYRLDRVPERNYIKFLDLIGVRLFPPTAATTRVTFWLSAPQETTVAVPSGVEVATPRTEAGDSAIAFTTTELLDIVPCEMSFITSIVAGGTWRNHTDALRLSSFSCFSPQPVPEEVLLIGLSTAVPRCAVSLRFDCTIEGIGVDPDWPPLTWEAYDGASWVTCEVDRDTTGGLNRPGEVVLHVPPTHVMSLEATSCRAGWLRARLTAPEEDQPFYSNSPLIRGLEVRTIGGTIEAVQAEVVEDEVLGLSEGVPGQRFEAARRPVVPSGEPIILEVSNEEEGWQVWTEVPDFAQSRAEDRHFILDAVGGEVLLGPAVRMPDGESRQLWSGSSQGFSGAHPSLPHGWWTPGQRDPAGDPRVPDDDPLRGPGGEPVRRHRRHRRGGGRRGRGVRPHRDAHAGPGGHRRGL